MLTDSDWRENAKCKGMDRKIFFPKNYKELQRAKQICSQCSVKEQCLRSAVEEPELFGVWGGVSERERMRKLVPAYNRERKLLTA